MMRRARLIGRSRARQESYVAQRPEVALFVTALHSVSGGAERVLADVANGLAARGYPVTVVTLQDHNGPSFYPLRFGVRRVDGRRRHKEGRGGPSWNALNERTKTNRVVAATTWLVRYAPRIRSLRRMIRLVRPTVAIAFLPSSYPYVTIAAMGTRTKTIASLHNVPDRDLGGDPQRWDQNPVDIWFRRRTLRWTALNTVLLGSFVDQLEESIRDATVVIPNPIEPYDGPPADLSTQPQDNVILAVGRLSHAKDHATLVESWARIADRHPTWRVDITGDGPLFDELTEQIRRLGVPRIKLTGARQDIQQAYLGAKLLAMPSVHEGFGLVTAEAMVVGLPVIGFADCEGTNEIIVDGVNGRLVEVMDDRAESFARVLEELILDEPQRVSLGTAAPKTTERFAPSQVIDLWEQAIDRAITGSPTS